MLHDNWKIKWLRYKVSLIDMSSSREKKKHLLIKDRNQLELNKVSMYVSIILFIYINIHMYICTAV